MNQDVTTGWWLGFTHYPAIEQVSLSTVKLCLSLSGDVCFCILWSETLLQLCNVFYAAKNVFVSKEIHAFYPFWGYAVLLLLVICQCLESNRHLTLQLNFDVCDSNVPDVFVSPTYAHCVCRQQMDRHHVQMKQTFQKPSKWCISFYLCHLVLKCVCVSGVGAGIAQSV